MLKFNVFPRCSEPVKFADCYVISETWHSGYDLALLLLCLMGCAALGVPLFLMCYPVLSYESNAHA